MMHLLPTQDKSNTSYKSLNCIGLAGCKGSLGVCLLGQTHNEQLKHFVLSSLPSATRSLQRLRESPG